MKWNWFVKWIQKHDIIERHIVDLYSRIWFEERLDLNNFSYHFFCPSLCRAENLVVKALEHGIMNVKSIYMKIQIRVVFSVAIRIFFWLCIWISNRTKCRKQAMARGHLQPRVTIWLGCRYRHGRIQPGWMLTGTCIVIFTFWIFMNLQKSFLKCEPEYEFILIS